MINKELTDLISAEHKHLFSDKMQRILDESVKYPMNLKMKEAEEVMEMMRRTYGHRVYGHLKHVYNNVLTSVIDLK